MDYYKIEVYEPIGGFRYIDDIFSSKENAKNRIAYVMADFERVGVQKKEKEGDGWYEVSFNIGPSFHLSYKVVRCYTY